MKEKKYLITDYMRDGRLGKTAMITSFQKFDFKILIDTDNKLVDAVTLKNALTLIVGIIKDGHKFYPHLCRVAKIFVGSGTRLVKVV